MCLQCRRPGFNLWVRKIPWRGEWQPIPLEMGILAWEIPWTEEPGGLQSMELQRVGYDWATNSLFLKNNYLLICLCRSDLCWGMQDVALWCSGLSSCGAQALEHVRSVTVVCGLSCFAVCGIVLPWPGIIPRSSALQGGGHWTSRQVPPSFLYYSQCWN